MRHAGIPRLYREFIAGIDYGPGTVLFIEPEPGPVLLENGFIGTVLFVIGQTFKKQSFGLQGHSLLAHPFVEGATEAAAAAAGGGGYPVKIGKTDVRFMQQHGKTEHLALHAFRREHDTEKRCLKGLRSFSPMASISSSATSLKRDPEYFLYLAQDLLVQGQDIIIDAANA